MNIVVTLIVGVVVGALARLVMPERDPGGSLLTVLLGIAGAFTASFLGRGLGWYGPGDSAAIVASVLGAMVLLVVYRAARGREVSR